MHTCVGKLSTKTVKNQLKDTRDKSTLSNKQKPQRGLLGQVTEKSNKWWIPTKDPGLWRGGGVTISCPTVKSNNIFK